MYFLLHCSFIPRITIYNLKGLSFVVWMCLMSLVADSCDGLRIKFPILCNIHFKIVFPFWNVFSSQTSPCGQELCMKLGSLWCAGGHTRLGFCNCQLYWCHPLSRIKGFNSSLLQKSVSKNMKGLFFYFLWLQSNPSTSGWVLLASFTFAEGMKTLHYSVYTRRLGNCLKTRLHLFTQCTFAPSSFLAQ